MQLTVQGLRDAIRDLPDEMKGNNILASVGESLPKWKASPFQLVSLLEMLKYNAARFYRIAQLAGELGKELSFAVNQSRFASILEAPIAAATKKEWLDIIETLLKDCSEIGLCTSANLLKQIKVDLEEDCEFSEFLSVFQSYHRTVAAELSTNHFLMIPSERVKFYQVDNAFGKAVADKFPKAVGDIEEAGNCYAVGRNTACVFHLMRVMEIGVRYFGKRMKIPNVNQLEWQPILNHINGAINKLGVAPPGTKLTAPQKMKRDKYAKAAVYLENVKNAWRNNVMHPKESYSDEEAEKVFQTVKAYMQYLAEIL